jgi:DNA-directed RNA polymerase subunit RPC12/RpoP
MLITCPKCQGRDVYPSRSNSPLERLLMVLNFPAYHCDECSTRFRHRTTREELRMLNRELLVRSAIRSLGSQITM